VLEEGGLGGLFHLCRGRRLCGGDKKERAHE